ncbi:unnamed protein product, partial [marine sediment metagenome]
MPEDKKNFIHLPIKDSAKFKKQSIREQVIGKKENGITAERGIPKGTTATGGTKDPEIFSYYFAESKGWTMDKAKEWLEGKDLKVHESKDDSSLHIKFDVPEPIRNFVQKIARGFIAGDLSHDGSKKAKHNLMESLGGIVDEAFGIPEPINAGVFANPPDSSPLTFRIWKTYSGIREADKFNAPAELESDYRKQLAKKSKEVYSVNHSLRIYWGDQLVSLAIEGANLSALSESACTVETEFTDPSWNDPGQMARRTFTLPNG